MVTPYRNLHIFLALKLVFFANRRLLNATESLWEALNQNIHHSSSRAFKAAAAGQQQKRSVDAYGLSWAQCPRSQYQHLQ